MRIATYNVCNENKGIGNRLDRVELFGTEVNLVNHLCASDHYGVLADIEFLKK